MLLLRWFVLMLTSMVGVVAFFILCGTSRRSPFSQPESDPDLRDSLLRAGLVADLLGAGILGSITGVPGFVAVAAGFVYFLGKLGLSDAAACWLSRRAPVRSTPLPEWEVSRLYERLSADRGMIRRGWLLWAGVALLNLLGLSQVLILACLVAAVT